MRNEIKSEAEKAFKFGNYEKATIEYQKLKSLSYSFEPEARLNLAHCYFQLKDTMNALQEYRKLLRIHDQKLKSTALNQIAIVNAIKGDSSFALRLFKEALQNSPENSLVRYNFEFLKKKMPPPPENNQSKQKQEEQETEQNVSPEQTEKKEDELQSLQIERMSRDKALQILEAMKANELQYIQQKSTKKKNKDYKDY